MPTKEELKSQLDALIAERDAIVKQKQISELEQKRDFLKGALEEKKFELVEQAKSAGMKKIEDAFGTIVSQAVKPFSNMKQYYQSERMSALKTVDDAIKNPSFWKTPLGIAAGTLQYVMSPISAVAKTAGAAVEEATGELLKTPMVNVEDAAQRDPLTEAEKTIAGDVAKFVGKLGEEAVYFVPIGKTLKSALNYRTPSAVELDIPKYGGKAPDLEESFKTVKVKPKVTQTGESILEVTPLPQMETAGSLKEITKPAMRDEVVKGITEASEEALRGSYDDSKRLFKNIAEKLSVGEINPEFLPDVLSRHNLSASEFAKIYVDTVSGAGRKLAYHSVLAKKLTEVFADNPEALELLSRHYKETPLTTVDKIIQGWVGMENVRRGLLVGQMATSMRNIFSQAGRITIGAFDESLQSVAKQVFGGPLETKESIFDGLNTVVAAVNRLRPSQRARLTEILEQNNDIISTMRFMSEPVNEVGMGKLAGMVNVLNRAQEHFFRKMAFEAKARTLLAKKGLDYNTINPKHIPEGLIEEAANYALEMTFAAMPKSKMASEMISAWTKIPFLTTIQPFPKFNFANAIPYLVEHSPLGYLGAIKPSVIKELASGNPDKFAKAASRATMGTLMLESAVRLRQSDYAGERWYELKTGEDKKGNATVVDLRSYAPLTTPLLIAEAIARPERLKPSDFIQAAIGMNRVAGTGLVAADWVRGKTGEELEKQIKNFAGQYFASFFTPARTLSDFYGAVDKEENVVRDPRSNSLLAPIMMTLPKISQEVPEQRSATKIGRMQKAEDIAGVPGGIMRQFTGISKRTKNAIEREIDTLGIEYSRISPRTKSDKADRLIKSYMAPYIQLVSPKLLESSGYKNADIEVKKLMLIGMFSEARNKARIKLSQTHPDLEIKIQVENMGAEKEAIVKKRIGQ